MNSFVLITYCIYLPIALVLTFWVAKVFFKNAYAFMLEIFHKREDLAKSTNHLYEVGFYLVTLGFALGFMRLRYVTEDFDSQGVFEVLSYKVGVLAIFLGGMVFFNLYMLFRGKQKSNENKRAQDRLRPTSGQEVLSQLHGK